MSNEKFIWDSFISKGANECGAAGLMGNMFAESGLNPTNLQNSYEKSLGMTDAQYTTGVDNGSYTNFVQDKAGYGLVQWTFWSLKQELLNYAKANKKSIGDLQMQCDFLWIQLNNNYKAVANTLKTAKSVAEASNVVLLQFERPADQSVAVQNKRAGYGQTYYDRYATGQQKGDESVATETYQEMGNGYDYEYQPATKGKYWNLPNQRTTGLVLHSVGCPQPKAQVFVNNFNKPTVGASVHGFIEPGKYIETAPTRVAKLQAKKCYHVGGDWNNSRIGIEMCEPSTIKYVGGATWVDLDPNNTIPYIKNVTATAAKVFADLCIYHSIDVSMISTHAEACKLGHGSNHGDPEHVWKAIGYNIAMFRQDVQNIINERKGDYISTMNKTEFEAILDAKFKEYEAKLPKTYTYLKDVPEWGRKSVQKCMDNGYMSGTGTDANGTVTIDLSNDLLRTIVLNDRAGIYDPKVETPVAPAVKA